MMMDVLFSFLSHDWSGLVMSLIVLAVAGAGLKLSDSRPLRWSWRVVAVAAGLLAVGAITHLVRIAVIDARYPAPGKMVDVGGRKMHVIAEGPTGGPTIVWLPGGHAGGLAFYDQHKAIRDDARSILVDRPGTGWSHAGPFPRTTVREADEVVTALEQAGEQGPFVFTGHSFGGLLAANIARRYPDKTAAVVLLDATPLDVIFYGLDRKGLGSLSKSTLSAGLRRIFGLYRSTTSEIETDGHQRNGDALELAQPLEVLRAVETHARSSFAGASIYKELTPKGLIDRAFDTVVFDGDLGDMPLYLVAPGEDASTAVYAEKIAGGPGPVAQRFENFLTRTRERYLAASSQSKRIYAPAGTGHNFPYEAPEFVTETMRGILKDTEARAEAERLSYETLAGSWPGPYGGLPPVKLATPATMEAAYRKAIAEKRDEVRAIIDNREPPTFENTVVALESSGRALKRIDALFNIFSTTASNDEIAEVASRIAPLGPRLEDEIAHDQRLFARVDAVYAGLPDSAPTPEARRLVTVTRDNLIRSGANLGPAEKERLSQINARLAELRTRFSQNVMNDEGALAVFIDDEERLAGLGEERITAAKAAAEARSRPDEWAVPIARPSVWPVLTNAQSRELREEVWRKWVTRGGNPGENDNRPVMAEILRLRGEKARFFGYPSFAHFQTAARMAGTPEAAMDMLHRTWELLLEPSRSEIEELQAIAAEEGADFEIQPWDRLYYAEKLRQRKYNLDADAVRPYLQLENVVEAMFWAAGRVYDLDFRELNDVEVVSPDIRVFEVTRENGVVGVLWLDLFQRPGKGPASWAVEYRSAESFRGKVLPLVALHSAVQRPVGGGPALVPWERANVIFHEFGHTLHTLSNGAAYPSLGSLHVAWDFIEVPALLNERWLIDRELLARFARHYETGDPMPDDLVDRVERVLKHDRVFSATLSFLGTAIVDMRLHLMADGREIDAMEWERSILDELEMPAAYDLTLYVPHAFHTFSKEYAAGVYSYLWSDVIAADIADAFLESPGGLYDLEVAKRWRSSILEVGNTIPAVEAFRNFRGRDPDPDALPRRFGLVP